MTKGQFRSALYNMLLGANGSNVTFGPDDEYMTIMDIVGYEAFARWVAAVRDTFFGDDPHQFEIENTPRLNVPFEDAVNVLWKEYNVSF